jgi:hypothetical protein
MAKPDFPPGRDHAADQALDHIPEALPPENAPPGGPDVSFPQAAIDNMSETGQANAQIPDWLLA